MQRRVRSLLFVFLFVIVRNAATQEIHPAEPLPVQRNGKMGYIDSRGNVVIPPTFERAAGFSEGLALVKAGGNSGYIDNKGSIVIAPQFLEANDFSEGLASFRAGNKWGYVDSTGKIAIAPRFDSVESFKEGLAAVKVENKWGYINEQGDIVIEPMFSFARSFSDGLAAVTVGEGSFPNRKTGYINRNGEFAIPPQFQVAGSFSEGLAYTIITGQLAFIDRTGQAVVSVGQIELFNPVVYFIYDLGDSRVSFYGGKAAVPVSGRIPLMDTKWTYIDKAGKTSVPVQFQSVGRFSEGMAAVAVAHRTSNGKMGEQWGYLDGAGKMVISPQFDSAEEFSNGVAQVMIGDKTGYIDQLGKFIWKPSK